MRSYVFLLLIVSAPFSTFAVNEDDYEKVESQSRNNSCFSFLRISSRHKKNTKNQQDGGDLLTYTKDWEDDFEDSKKLLENFELNKISYKGEVDAKYGDILFAAEFTGSANKNNTMIIEYGIKLSYDGNRIEGLNAKAKYPAKVLHLPKPEFYQSGGLEGKGRMGRLRTFNFFILSKLFKNLEKSHEEICDESSETIHTQNDIEKFTEFMNTFRKHPLSSLPYGKSMEDVPGTKRAIESFFEENYPVSKLKPLIYANNSTN